jgi:hypothetical protein
MLGVSDGNEIGSLVNGTEVGTSLGIDGIVVEGEKNGNAVGPLVIVTEVGISLG